MTKKKSSIVTLKDNDDKFVNFQNKERDRFYAKMDSAQHELFDSVQNNIFTFVQSKAGTGKTTVVMAAMIDLLAKGAVDKIIYVVKPSQRNFANGYLPGTLEDKTQALYYAVYDALEVLGFSSYDIHNLRAQEQLMLITDNNLRGINLSNVAVFADEGENYDMETLKLLFTRCHDDVHCVLGGDEKQVDNRHWDTHAFVEYGDYLCAFPWAKKCVLTKNYRGRFSNAAEDF